MLMVITCARIKPGGRLPEWVEEIYCAVGSVQDDEKSCAIMRNQPLPFVILCCSWDILGSNAVYQARLYDTVQKHQRQKQLDTLHSQVSNSGMLLSAIFGKTHQIVDAAEGVVPRIRDVFYGVLPPIHVRNL